MRADVRVVEDPLDAGQAERRAGTGATTTGSLTAAAPKRWM